MAHACLEGTWLLRAHAKVGKALLWYLKHGDCCCPCSNFMYIHLGFDLHPFISVCIIAEVVMY